MHSFITKATLAMLAGFSTVLADTGFSIASDTYCLEEGDPEAGGGFDCYSGTSVVPAGSWNCYTLQHPPADVWYDDDGSFHVAGKDGNSFCGVGQLDM